MRSLSSIHSVINRLNSVDVLLHCDRFW